jgi:excisionase family DNA binding protein
VPEQLLSIDDLAELLQVPRATIYRWNHRGLGPTPLHIGRHVRYRPSDVNSWIEAQALRARDATPKVMG